MRQIALFSIIAVLLGGCATEYAPSSFWNDGGFIETEVQPGLFQVRFEGNEFTDTARTADFAMLRAAELCLSRNQGFMLLGDVATEVIQSGYIPGTTTSTTTGSATGYAYGNTTRVSGTATTTSYTTPGAALYRPETGLTVACLNEKLDRAWDAEFLARSMRGKYKIGQ
jgi:hypothetical protein